MTDPSLLRRVSRSFFLSLWLLPSTVRPTISLAYLLARASDSIADVAAAPLDVRIRILEKLPASVSRADIEMLGSLPENDRELLWALPDLLDQVAASPDSGEILAVWRTVVSGQLFDLQRFGGGAQPLSLGETEDYTGLVAGCVGEFWTRICHKWIPDYSTTPFETLRGWGFDFGCGLQWVNILRDRHADAAAGRVYVTDGDFPAALGIARAKLGAGSRYAAAVRPRRLRAACRLPLALGFRTLDLVEANPRAADVKAGRIFVWFALAKALLH